MRTPLPPGRTPGVLAVLTALTLSLAGLAPASLAASFGASGARGPMCAGQAPTLVGTPGDDVLTGTPGADVIAGLGGHDVIRGLGGDDVMCGGAKRDRILGGAGDDLLVGDRGKDLLRGGLGADTIHGGPGLDFEYGGASADDHLVGNRGSDFLSDTGDGATFSGDGGNDEIRAVGPSRMSGGHGFDGLFSESCGCTELGGPGRDSLVAIAGGAAPARLFGGHGSDTVDFESDVRPSPVLQGGAGHDSLILTLHKHLGMRAPYRRIVVDLAGHVVRAGTDVMPLTSFANVEIDGYTGRHGHVIVSRAFTLIGTGGRNTLDAEIGGGFSPTFDLFGKGGDDTLLGGGAADRLVGGRGHDRGDGRAGRDTCVSVEAGAEGVTQPCEVMRP